MIRSMIKEYNHINPTHYNLGDKEVWEVMISVYGLQEFLIFCKLNAFKYRMRMGKKPDQSIDREYQKMKWYEDKIRELTMNSAK